jgi:hypothetical protein
MLVIVTLLASIFVLGVAPGVVHATQLACVNKTDADGLGDSFVRGVHADGNTIYAATLNGLSISTNGGTTFTNLTTTSAGLGSNEILAVYAVGSTIYAATNDGGLSISTNSATTFTNVTTSAGLGSNQVRGVYAVGNTIYAATSDGLGISTNGGTSFTNVTTSAGLLRSELNDVYADGNTIYAATTAGGLGISTNGGTSFTNVTTSDGLGSDAIISVFAVGNTIYAGTYDGGLGISTDGGATFTNKTTANGLGSNRVDSVYADGNTIYATTYDRGLSISTDNGATFTNFALGPAGNLVFDVYAVGNTVYAATTGGLRICVLTLPPATISTPSGTPILAVNIDVGGGSCGSSSSLRFVGAGYLPGASECTKPGYTFTGWARTTAPTVAVDLPLLVDPSDGVRRYFVASNVDLVAIWTKNPAPITDVTVFANFLCGPCTTIWLIHPPVEPDVAVDITIDDTPASCSIKADAFGLTFCQITPLTPGNHTIALTPRNGSATGPPTRISVILNT